MPIVLPGDLDVFFDGDGFGEPVTYTAPGGTPIGAVAIWDRGLATPSYGQGGDVALATNRFSFRADVVGEPVDGAEIVIVATGAAFIVSGAAEAGLDGATWICGAAPA